MKNWNRSPDEQTMLRSLVWSTTFVLLISIVVPAGPVTSAQAGLDRAVRVEGELEIVYEDSHGHGGLIYFLHSGGKKLEIKFAQEPPQTLRTGMRVIAA